MLHQSSRSPAKQAISIIIHEKLKKDEAGSALRTCPTWVAGALPAVLIWGVVGQAMKIQGFQPQLLPNLVQHRSVVAYDKTTTTTTNLYHFNFYIYDWRV